jgi:hypothetical protein
MIRAFHVLSSWKEIARHMGKGVRTVQRWERLAELPVHRPAGSAGLVLAYPQELDAWAHHRAAIVINQAESDNSQLIDQISWSRKLSRTRKLELRQLRDEMCRYRTAMVHLRDSIQDQRRKLRSGMRTLSSCAAEPLSRKCEVLAQSR